MATYNLKVMVYNDSDLDFTLAGANVGIGSWDERPSNSLAAGTEQTCTCESYNMNGTNMSLGYTASDGTQFMFWSSVPPMVRNVWTPTVSNSGWNVTGGIGYGSSPTSVFHVSKATEKPPIEFHGITDPS